MAVTPTQLDDATSACPVCDTANARDATCCATCGAPVNLPVCPQCEAVNARGASRCWKCAATLTQSLDGVERSGQHADVTSDAAAPQHEPREDAAQPAHAIHDSAVEAPATARAPALPVCACGVINAVNALYCRTCNAPLEHGSTAPARSTSPLDATLAADEEIDVPQHYIGSDFDAAIEPVTPAATVRARWRAGWTILAALALLVLPAVIAVGVYAHYRPAVVSHLVAATKLRLHLAQWASIDDTRSAAAASSTLPPVVPASTGLPEAPHIPAAPTGIPGTSSTPASIPPLSPPTPARIPDVATSVPAPTPAAVSRPLPANPPPITTSRERTPPKEASRATPAASEPMPNRTQDARLAARGEPDDGDGYVSPSRNASRTPGPDIAWDDRDVFAPDRPRGRRSDGTTSVCTPEIVDQGLCRPEVRGPSMR